MKGCDITHLYAVNCILACLLHGAG